MTDRIKALAGQAVKGELWFECTQPTYDREDIFLSPLTMKAKRAKEYILAQNPVINENTALTGYLRFEGDVMGDNFGRSGHENYRLINELFYNQPISSSITFEFQHSVADFEKVIKIGLQGFKKEIAASKSKQTDFEKIEFLDALDTTCDAIIGWANRCADIAEKKASESSDEKVKARLKKLAAALKNVPEKPASSFYEAVLTIYVIYAFVPDSIGTIDRYLYPFFKNDIENGILTKEESGEYLQELFIMLQSRISIKSDRFYRGGESHFCIGGYLPDGSDGFNELSRLVVDSLMDLPTYIPQISLRWTKKTPAEVLYYMMDCERKDPNKRIAFVNDEPRLKMLTEYVGFPFELACNYTMVGCNEPQLPGGIFMGGCDTNGLKPVESTLYNRSEDILNAEAFDDFYDIFEDELFKFLTLSLDYYNKFQLVRSRDRNFISAMFYEGVIDRALSITEGGAKNAIANIQIMGISNVIDSLTVVKQFVYDEKYIDMQTLLDAIKANWQGYEKLRAEILRKAKFFGNDEDISNEIGKRYASSVTSFLDGKTTDLGYKIVVGNLTGYNPHNKWFGDGTLATPDGRYNGYMLNFGVSQTESKDREGLTALLMSVAKFNANELFCGSTVTNVLLEEQLIKNDANFEKTVKLFETYFKLGGLHFQLNYISRQDLLNAQKEPEKYRSLRVRVSGFSDYFMNLEADLQNEIVKRTEVKG